MVQDAIDARSEQFSAPTPAPTPVTTRIKAEWDIDWIVLEKQLEAWGCLFRAGKKLRMDISFNYLETGPAVGNSTRYTSVVPDVARWPLRI